MNVAIVLISRLEGDSGHLSLNSLGRRKGSNLTLPHPLPHPPPSFPCCSCCVWFSILYVGLLTILVLLLAAFSGYILVTTWQMDEHNNFTSSSIQDEIKKLRDGKYRVCVGGIHSFSLYTELV